MFYCVQFVKCSVSSDSGDEEKGIEGIQRSGLCIILLAW